MTVVTKHIHSNDILFPMNMIFPNTEYISIVNATNMIVIPLWCELLHILFILQSFISNLPSVFLLLMSLPLLLLYYYANI